MLNFLSILLGIYIFFTNDFKMGDKNGPMMMRISAVITAIISYRCYSIGFVPFWVFVLLLTLALTMFFKCKYVEGVSDDEKFM